MLDPPAIHTSPSASARASSRERAVSAPGASYDVSRVRTMLRRPGSGRTDEGNDSHVARPITTVDPIVRRLKFCCSSGSRQGIEPSLPMTRSAASAQMRVIVIRPPPHPPPNNGAGFAGSYCYRRAQRGVVAIVDELHVLEGVVEQRRRAAQLEARERVDLS